MSKLAAVLDKCPLRSVVSVALAVIVFCVVVLITSMRGSLESAIRFEQAVLPALAVDKEIAGWADFDRDSYFLGQHAICRIRILYRNDTIKPDLEAFKRDLGFLPFDQIGVRESLTDIGNGLTEYVFDYELHIIGVRKPDSYALKPAVLQYSNIRDAGSNLHTLRIPLASLQVGSFYPWNVGRISLLGIRDRIFNQNPWRQALLVLGGTVLLVLAGFILWRFGRRRNLSELAVPEQLWRQFTQINGEIMDNRTYLLACERILTRLLHHQIAMDPDMFWSGDESADPSWNTLVNQGRELLRRVYQVGDITDDDVLQMKTLLSERLAFLVDQSRLILEQPPSLFIRIRQQQPVATTLVVVSALAILFLILASVPNVWLAPEIKRYNESVARIRSGQEPVENLLLDLQSLAGSARIEKIRKAALYNSGTTRATYSFGETPPATQSKILELIFDAESADALLQTLLLAELASSQEDIVSMLVNAAERLLQSELDLQTAARMSGDDEDILRNLELATKWRHAILTRLTQLRDMFKMNASDAKDEEAASDQGIVDIINSKLPDEYEDAEMAKDNSHYIIFERF